ncbi:transcriptional regulator MraZ [Atopobacter sp. AH10]|uniref:division/cell wall cluster transcriptional repressor MraZ n=1 Tax=Atopobacter sp. AH10 TaxID=2315861 RepID=UPI000EF2019E|nr:division/cell wall cluster transcriptional repressor MraZ [Atopobacter sp. AH10]RLK62938.1 transcriptional regulator MraZ [Atopobacter sp. AH10]
MLIGEYQHTIDSKGRIIVPAKFREELDGSFVLTRGLDGCLFGYPRSSWERVRQQLKELPISKRDSRAFVRFFYSSACEVEIDKQGRINIPKELIDYAAIEKDCRIVGVSDRIEIWASHLWEEFTAETEEQFDDIAEHLMGIDF